ncbi:hypothetical protein EYR36_008820 [Pleurotus pulmonarius]|nr:hypothetical protein EYR36_008820 [Pleurotus pulmonarius]
MKFPELPAVLVSLLLTVLLSPEPAVGLPATQTGYISVPLTSVHDTRDPDVHPDILHQRHVNRGLTRYARLSGRAEPSPLELLTKMKNRLDSLHPDIRKRYNHEGIEESISHLVSINSIFPGAPVPNQAHVSDEGAGGYSPSLLAVAVTHTVTEAKQPEFPSTMGLDIQGNELGYMGHFLLGTPPKKFRLLMDTGSADLWVGGEDCTAQGGGGCGKHQFLGPKSSSTYNQTDTIWAIRYGSGAVLGHLVYDRFEVAGLVLEKFFFGVARNETIQFTPDRIPFDGIAGTARSMISRQRTKTFVEALYEAGLIKDGIASYKIPRVTTMGVQSDGELTLGAMNPANYDPATLVTLSNISPIGFWEVFLQDVKVGGKSIGFTSRNVILDTGTTLFLAPKDDVALLHRDIPGAIYNGHAWTVPCTTTAVITLNFGGKEFPIDPRDLAFIPLDTRDLKGNCASAITEVVLHSGQDHWLLGDVFLKNVYFSTNIRTNQVSMARLPASQ